jgi:hypothetical protein
MNRLRKIVHHVGSIYYYSIIQRTAQLLYPQIYRGLSAIGRVITKRMNKPPPTLHITSTGISVCVSKAARYYVGAMIPYIICFN